jgi:hypothetical protein
MYGFGCGIGALCTGGGMIGDLSAGFSLDSSDVN